MNYNLQSIYVKCARVIKSCKTVGQLYGAAKYVALAAKLPGFDRSQHDVLKSDLTTQIKFVKHYGTKTKTRNTSTDNPAPPRQD